MNGYTHAFDIINKDVYDYLKRKSTENVSDNTLSKLVKRGYLTSLTEDQELELIKRITDGVHDSRRFQKYNFQFIMSYDCNLRCVYCFEKEVLNTSKCPSKDKITKDKIDRAFDIIYEKYENKQCTQVIGLYGGEPFLAENYDLVSYIIEKGKKCNFTFYAPTNGYDIDAYFDLLKENSNLFHFQITLDGVEEIQNRNRPHFKNKDSFEKITNNIDHLLKLGITIRLRINTSEYSLTKMNELMSLFEAKGWYGYENFSAYWALLRDDIDSGAAPAEGEKPQINQLDLMSSFQEQKATGNLSSKLSCQDYGISSILNNMILGKDVKYKGYFCGAQVSSLIFDPVGDLYSCWDVVGQPEHKVGSYIPDLEISEEGYQKWFDDKISGYKCIKCKYVLFCGGGCVIRSLKSKKRIRPGNCNQYPQVFNSLVKNLYQETIKENYNQI
ncbi:uncharacterized protein CLV62_11919 [Dysgonomonas alginatilytica]|uniref:Radical SAM core domain-containing protein n=2 Tax=Dysgonomonas alginatilytica TaxID=1605892 RepID=A0A2V3PLB7_9BACT|nr:uncharacterized protein CLV62_11919 [Dysgonomonas alginatilytica]